MAGFRGLLGRGLGLNFGVVNRIPKRGSASASTVPGSVEELANRITIVESLSLTWPKIVGLFVTTGGAVTYIHGLFYGWMRDDMNAIKQEMKEFKQEVRAFKGEVTGQITDLQTRAHALETTVSVLHVEVQHLETNMQGLKADMQNLGTDMRELRREMLTGFREIQQQLRQQPQGTDNDNVQPRRSPTPA